MIMNKKTILTMLLLVLTLGATAQVKAEVSETVELMGILSRVAGYHDYSNNLTGDYSKDTEEWFAPFKDHPTVTYYQRLPQYGIGYDKVANMGVHLEIKKGKIKLVGDKAELTGGWQHVDLKDFVKRLNKFYKDTRFHEFFEQHQAFYAEGAKYLEKAFLAVFHPEWYTRFYYGREPIEKFRFIVSFTNGGINYGVWRQLPRQPREVINVAAYILHPLKGRPMVDQSLLLHEFNHPFVNPILDDAKNAALLKDVGEKLLQLSAQPMYNSWDIVINESVVRAAVIICMQDNNYDAQMIDKCISVEIQKYGFPWIRELVDALRYYSSHRDQYPTLNDFYPEINKCLNKYLADRQQSANPSQGR